MTRRGLSVSRSIWFLALALVFCFQGNAMANRPVVERGPLVPGVSPNPHDPPPPPDGGGDGDADEFGIYTQPTPVKGHPGVRAAGPSDGAQSRWTFVDQARLTFVLWVGQLTH